MDLVFFITLIALAFFGAYFFMGGMVKLVKKVNRPERFDLPFSLGLSILLPLMILSPFVDTVETNPVSYFFSGAIAFALIVLYTMTFQQTRKDKFWSIFFIGFVASYLLPATLPIFASSMEFNLMIHVLLALYLATFTCLFAWVDKVPFVSLSFTLGSALLIVLLSTIMPVLPSTFGIFAMFLLTTQMGVCLCLKPFMPFRLENYASYAIGFLWGIIGIYLIASGYFFTAVFTYGYYICEFFFVAITSYIAYRSFGLKTPFMVEKAIATNIEISRIFKVIMLYTFVIGLCGFWFDRSLAYSFLGAIALFVGYMIYQFNNWTSRPTYRNVFKEMKSGFTELKTNIVEAKKDVKLLKEKKTIVKPAAKKITVQKVAVKKTKAVAVTKKTVKAPAKKGMKAPVKKPAKAVSKITPKKTAKIPAKKIVKKAKKK